MSLVPCRECNTPIAHDARRCPICAKEDPARWEQKKKLRLRVFLLIMMVGAAGYFWFVLIPAFHQHGILHHPSQSQ